MALHKKYGPLVRIAPNEIACADTKAIKELYRNQNPLAKSDFYATWHSQDFGRWPDNFSVRDEKVHAARRRIVNNVYSLSNVLQSEQYIDKCSKLFIQKLGKFADLDCVVDLGKWLQMYAFDVIGELYFGHTFGFMETELDYENYIRSLDTLNPVMAAAAVSATYARPFVLGSAATSSEVRNGLKAIAHVTNAAKHCVTIREREIASTKEIVESPRKDMLQQLFDIMHEKGERLDFGIPEIQYEAYVALFAGSDTTAIAMRSVFYHLTRTPEALTSLRRELDEAFPTSQHHLEAPIKYADAITLPYLCATIKEAMRLHPSVGFTMPRVSPAPEGLKICGVHIPPGYRVGINANTVQRDKDIYGSDADLFRPERWLEARQDVLREMEGCMLVFGAGTRTCIGKNISLSELHKLIPLILRNFELDPTEPSKEWQTHNYWFNKQTGLEYRLRRRTT